MQGKEENEIDNQYIFRYKDGPLSEVITYRKYLIGEIMKTQPREETMRFRIFRPKVSHSAS